MPTDTKVETPRVDDPAWESARGYISARVSVNENGCWLWQRSRQPAQYGHASYGGKPILAHRLSYVAFVDDIRPGMMICHRCDVPACTNPDHLFEGTGRDNWLDCINKGRQRSWGGRGVRAYKTAALSMEQAKEVKARIDSRTGTLKQLSAELGISLHVLKELSRGRTYF